MEFGGVVRVGERPFAGRLVDAQRRINRSVSGMLDLILELDTEEARRENSVTDMVSWLRFDLGLEAKTARAWVRVARGVGGLAADPAGVCGRGGVL